jgi:hypothetical protein
MSCGAKVSIFPTPCERAGGRFPFVSTFAKLSFDREEAAMPHEFVGGNAADTEQAADGGAPVDERRRSDMTYIPAGTL